MSTSKAWRRRRKLRIRTVLGSFPPAILARVDLYLMHLAQALPYDCVFKNNLDHALWRVVEDLTFLESMVIQLRFLKGLQIQQIARVIGATWDRTREIEARALRLLARRIPRRLCEELRGDG